MTDLIWIGNALYPRWVVFAAVAAAPVTILLIEIVVGVIQLVRELRR